MGSIIDIKYDPQEIQFIKSLKTSYWNEIEKKWICRGTLPNLRALQNRYQHWNELQYSKIEKLIQLSTSEKRAILRMAADEDRMELKFTSRSNAPSWLKKMANRGYDSKRKLWTLAPNSHVKNRLLSKLKASGYHIEDYTIKASDHVNHSRDWTLKRKHILAKVPAELRSELETFLDVLIRERYAYNTITNYIGAITRFLHYLQEAHISEIDNNVIGNYLSSIANSAVSNPTINLHQSALRLYCGKIHAEKKISFEMLKRPRKHHTLPNVMTKGEVRLLLGSVKNIKHLNMLYLAYGAGLRSAHSNNKTSTGKKIRYGSAMKKGTSTES